MIDFLNSAPIPPILDYITENCMIAIPVLYAAGILIKNMQIVKDKYIPLILLFAGLVICIFITRSVFSGITQGILCAGTAVFCNQVIKQLRKKE